MEKALLELLDGAVNGTNPLHPELEYTSGDILADLGVAECRGQTEVECLHCSLDPTLT
jgi:hypothetical protein